MRSTVTAASATTLPNILAFARVLSARFEPELRIELQSHQLWAWPVPVQHSGYQGMGFICSTSWVPRVNQRATLVAAGMSAFRVVCTLPLIGC